ncbi:MAG: O-antigen ligase family protein, partial [Candidatus Limnocylindrales bacterium]
PGIASRYEQLVSAVNSRSGTIDPGTLEGEVSVTERVLATVAGLRMAVDHPILGVGPGQFATQYEYRYRAASATRYLDSAHDMLAYVAAEFGLPVAGLLVLGLGAALLLAWQTMRRATEALERIAAASVLAALVGFLVVGLTFGVDLYRAYRLVDSDVVCAALLVGTAIALWAAGRRPLGTAAAGELPGGLFSRPVRAP